MDQPSLDSASLRNEQVANVTVHWPSGPVKMCLPHSLWAQEVALAMGFHLVVEPYNGTEPCVACAKKAEREKKRT